MPQKKLVEITEWYLARRHTFLFYTLLVTLAAAPVLAAFGFSANRLQYFLALSLFAAAIGTRGRGRWFVSTLVVAAICLRFGSLWMDIPVLPAVSLMIWAAIASVAAAAALRYSMIAPRVGAEQLYAGLSAYLLAGHFFGVFYWAIEQGWPGSFTLGGAAFAEGDFTLGRAIYFSFVTLATLGYGDVVPAGDVTRGIAVVEAIAGQLYLAVMVARLVSLASQKPEG
jgi:hypothetical protein